MSILGGPKIFAPQTKAAQRIYDNFCKGGRYAVLSALCQSGKTGCSMELIRLLIANGVIDRAVWVVSLAEKNLLADMKRDLKAYMALFANQSPRFPADLIASGKVVAMSRMDMQKMVRTNKQVSTFRTLFILDESHLCSDKGQTVDKFFTLHGMDLFGENEALKENQTYVMSVSATPYAELASIYHKKCRDKFVTFLQPGDGYRGVRWFMDQRRIRPTFPLLTKEGELSERFVEMVETRIAVRGPEYYLVRVMNNAEAIAAIRSEACERGWKVINYSQGDYGVAFTRSEVKDGIPCAEDKPEVPTLVILKNLLRAGKVVPKMHIGFVWEDSKNPDTDTIIQGLLGRMCGYKNLFGDNIPDIYVSNKQLSVVEDQMDEGNELERALKLPIMVPRYARNCHAGRGGSRTTHTRNPTVPLRMGNFTEVFDYADDEKKLFKFLKRTLQELECINDSPFLTDDQKDELLHVLPEISRRGGETNPARKGALRYIEMNERTEELKHEAFFRHDFLPAFQNNETPREHMDEDVPVTFVIVKVDDFEGASRGDVFVYLNTEAPTKDEYLPKSYRIPVPSEISIFYNDKKAAEVAVSHTSRGLSDKALEIPALFKIQLKNMIKDWKKVTASPDDYGVMDNAILSLPTRPLQLRKSKFCGGNSLETIMASMEELGVRLTYTAKEENDAYINLEKIEWALA